MQTKAELDSYRWDTAALGCAHDYLLPAVQRILAREVARGAPKRLFDLGCGNGAVARLLADDGWKVAGIDPSSTGIAHASNLDLRQRSTQDDLAGEFGQWPFVLSLEVVEHVYDPHLFAKRVFELLEPSGLALISTPYHGYIKNFVMGLAPSAWDRHWHPLCAGGHIKFWSCATLSELLKAAGLDEILFVRVGRVPPLAKSLLATCRRAGRADRPASPRDANRVRQIFKKTLSGLAETH
jgi:2-polyprenyl-6-hydroxyphenyl methylase/3-demethylubiquinone-9 3-methyltransferase